MSPSNLIIKRRDLAFSYIYKSTSYRFTTVFQFIVSNEAENGEELIFISPREPDNDMNTKNDLTARTLCKIRIKLKTARIL